jgi:hypothetical protein
VRGGGCSQPGTFASRRALSRLLVAKLEHANVSSKLQCSLPRSNLLATVLHLILHAFIVSRLEYFII